MSRIPALSVAAIALVAGAVVGAFPVRGASAGVAIVDTNPATQQYAFSPRILRTSPGIGLTWTNRSSVGHTVTPNSPSEFTGSAFIPPGGTFSITFSRAGTYPYFCAVHPFMTGTIIVSVPSTAPPTAPPTRKPTPRPTAAPTPRPTAAPTPTATAAPTPTATAAPTPAPSVPPLSAPTPAPTPLALAPTTQPVPSGAPVAPVTAPPAGPGSSLPLLLVGIAIVGAILGLGAALVRHRRAG